MKKPGKLAEKLAKQVAMNQTMKYTIGVVVLVALIAVGGTLWYIEANPTHKPSNNGGGLKVEESAEGAESRHITTAQAAAAARQNAEGETMEKNTAIPGCKSEKEKVEPIGRNEQQRPSRA